MADSMLAVDVLASLLPVAEQLIDRVTHAATWPLRMVTCNLLSHAFLLRLLLIFIKLTAMALDAFAVFVFISSGDFGRFFEQAENSAGARANNVPADDNDDFAFSREDQARALADYNRLSIVLGAAIFPVVAFVVPSLLLILLPLAEKRQGPPSVPLREAGNDEAAFNARTEYIISYFSLPGRVLYRAAKPEYNLVCLEGSLLPYLVLLEEIGAVMLVAFIYRYIETDNPADQFLVLISLITSIIGLISDVMVLYWVNQKGSSLLESWALKALIFLTVATVVGAIVVGSTNIKAITSSPAPPCTQAEMRATFKLCFNEYCKPCDRDRSNCEEPPYFEEFWFEVDQCNITTLAQLPLYDGLGSPPVAVSTERVFPGCTCSLTIPGGFSAWRGLKIPGVYLLFAAAISIFISIAAIRQGTNYAKGRSTWWIYCLCILFCFPPILLLLNCSSKTEPSGPASNSQDDGDHKRPTHSQQLQLHQPQVIQYQHQPPPPPNGLIPQPLMGMPPQQGPLQQGPPFMVMPPQPPPHYAGTYFPPATPNMYWPAAPPAGYPPPQVPQPGVGFSTYTYNSAYGY